MKSVWSMETKIDGHNMLSHEIEADVCVIGAGMAGILTAYLLQKSGLSVVVLEMNEVGSGMTKNTTAKISAQHRLIYERLIRQFGVHAARQYATANQKAIASYQNIIETNQIACGFELQPSYVYSVDDTKQLKLEADAAKRLGLDTEFTTQTDLPFKVMGAVCMKGQAQFQPLEFIKYIAKELTIYEHTCAREITEDNVVITSSHIQGETGQSTKIRSKVKAKYVVMTTHYPYINVPGFYFMRMHQEESYVVCLKQKQGLSYGMYIADKEGYSFRRYKDFILVGGENHRTGTKLKRDHLDELTAKASSWYPESEIIARWSNQDCVTMDGVPYIGQYAKNTPGLYVATGFNKWGMTNSMVAAELIHDAICQIPNPNAQIFLPSRFELGASIVNATKDGAMTVSRLALQLVSLPKKHTEDILPGCGGVVNYQGHKVGVYKDDEGSIFAVSTKCPHLGCMLSWNEQELTWDCPCHGSRFDVKGNRISNPTQKDLECHNKIGEI